MDQTIRLAAQRVNAWHMARVLLAAESSGLQAAALQASERSEAKNDGDVPRNMPSQHISDASSSARA